MVRITNGKEVLTVTNNAYKEIFMRSGYRLYDEVKEQEEVATRHTVTQQPAEPMKPISQWTRKELVEYIVKHGYKAEGKTDELRSFVKKHMDDAE